MFSLYLSLIYQYDSSTRWVGQNEDAEMKINMKEYSFLLVFLSLAFGHKFKE